MAQRSRRHRHRHRQQHARIVRADWLALRFFVCFLGFLGILAAIYALFTHPLVFYGIVGVLVLVGSVVAFTKVRRWWRGRHALVLDTRYIPDAMRRAILERDHYRCCQCGSPSRLELDHIIPRSRGGATSYGNLRTLCRSCNARKGNR